ncbi:MAG: glycosyltransferase family 2 protein [Chitinivibrionales bacterium]|nr:glycosyltransferase family 2 protein [Chitinivibrionales bacterium]
MKIALLVPSRERINHKMTLATSIALTAHNIGDVVLYFGIDSDDPTKEYFQAVANAFSFIKLVIIPSDGTFHGLGRLWNVCAHQSSEEIIAMIGDDMIFHTIGWDREIINQFQSPDPLKMVYCNDGAQQHRIAVNCFVHRSYVDITGYFMREDFLVDYMDVWIQQVFSALGRLYYRPDIFIEHRHWSFGKSAVDGVVQRMRGNDAPQKSLNVWNSLTQERILEVQKIAKYLKIEPDLSKISATINHVTLKDLVEMHH